MSDINYNQETINQFLADYDVKETGSRKKPYAYIERPWQRIERPWKRITRPWEPVERPWQNYKAPWTSTRNICPHMLKKAPADDEGIGYRGHGWKIIRDGKERAVACPGDKNDTIETLAKKIGLDANESSKWLFDAYGEAVTKDEFTYRKAYTIPNTVVVVAGTGQSNNIADARSAPPYEETDVFVKIARNFAKGLQEDHFKVIPYYRYSGDEFMNTLANKDVLGLVFVGHSSDNKLLFSNRAEVLQRKYYKEIALRQTVSAERIKYIESPEDILIQAQAEYKKIAVTAERIQKVRKCRMGYLILISCRASKTGDWSAVYSKNALKFIPEEDIEVNENKFPYIPPKGVR